MLSLPKVLRGSLVLVLLLVAGAGLGLWALGRRDGRPVGLPVTGRVRLGQRARVTVDAFPREAASEAEFTPRNVQTPKERAKLVFRVKITIENPDGRLKPGMPADAVVATDGSP